MPDSLAGCWRGIHSLATLAGFTCWLCSPDSLAGCSRGVNIRSNNDDEYCAPEDKDDGVAEDEDDSVEDSDDEIVGLSVAEDI
jgi:hypothetical protein